MAKNKPVREQKSLLADMTDEELDEAAKITPEDVMDAKAWAESSIKDPMILDLLDAKEKGAEDGENTES